MHNSLYAKPDYNYHRIVQGAPVGADSTNLAILLTANPKGAFDCAGYKTVKGFVKLTGGTTPTVGIQPLELVLYNNSSELLITASTVASLADGAMFEFTINGGKLFLRINATSGSPTKVEILVAGSERDFNDSGRRI